MVVTTASLLALGQAAGSSTSPGGTTIAGLHGLNDMVEGTKLPRLNTEVVALAEWMRAHNDGIADARRRVSPAAA